VLVEGRDDEEGKVDEADLLAGYPGNVRGVEALDDHHDRTHEGRTPRKPAFRDHEHQHREEAEHDGVHDLEDVDARDMRGHREHDGKHRDAQHRSVGVAVEWHMPHAGVQGPREDLKL
jgi:hypothetical protein